MRVCRSEKIGSPAWKASSRCPHVLVSAGAARYIRTDSSRRGGYYMRRDERRIVAGVRANKVFRIAGDIREIQYARCAPMPRD